MTEHAMHNDNDGRRNRLRNAFSNDPMYRRVKDAIIIIGAVIAGFGYLTGDASPLEFLKKGSQPVQGPLESRGEIWRRINSNDQNIAILQASMRNLENGQADIKQDVRELLRQVGQIRR